MRNWVEQLEADIALLSVERDALWRAIAVLDPDGKVPFGPLDPSPMVITSGSPASISVTASSAVAPGKRPARKTPAKPKRPGRRFGSGKKPVPPSTDAQVTPISSARGSVGRPRPGKYDFAKVAEVAHAAALAGETIRSAVKGLYPDISDDMASWVITTARKRGFTIARQQRQTLAPVTKPRPVPTSPAATRDWPTIAKQIIELRDGSKPIAEGIAKIYKVPESTARNWMVRCREMGLVKPVNANLKVIEDNTTDDESTAVYNAAAVANAYLDAIRTNLRPIQFVADSLGIDKQTAVGWVRQARLDGELPATSIEPQLPEAERRKLLDMSKPEPVA